MDEYLSTTISKLKGKHYGELNLVIGNESCDLDSAVSSIVYSAFLYWQYNQIQCKVCTRSKRNKDSESYKDDIFLPVLNVLREDYNLKTEVVYCLKTHGINENNLIFRDDYNLEQFVLKPKTNIVLVDHHVLLQCDEFLAPYVTEIIDHRPIDKSRWNYRDDVRSTIETVGSCCTLVTQRIKDLSALMSRNDEFFHTYPACTDLLYGTILLDTVNFSKEFNKATPRDLDIVLYLETFTKPADNIRERKEKLDRLVEARKDVTSLTAAQLLRKDVKIQGEVLVPSFPILVKEFLLKPGASQSITEALSRSGCSIAVLLGMDLALGLSRDVAVCGTNNETTVQLSQHLQAWTTPDFQLLSASSPVADLIYYTQSNLGATRKQFIPAIKDFVDKNK